MTEDHTEFASEVAERRAVEHREMARSLLEENFIPPHRALEAATVHALLALEARLEMHHWETQS